ncbi:MAG: hypothetical protein Q9204_008309, partial [Flavoplaca sp. TL-2023a]
ARDKLARLLFGPKGEGNATPAMKRLLTSWLSMGYPGKALEHLMEQDSKRGRGKNRDSLGFPYRSRSRYPSRRVHKESSPGPQKPKRNTPQGNQPLDRSSLIEDPKCARKFPLHPKKPNPNTPQKLQSSSSGSATTLIEAAGFTKKNGHGTYIPGDSDSPPTSDDPPEDLLWELTDLDRNSSGDSKAADTEEPRVSFWDFVSTHCPEYRGNVGPLPRTPRGKSHVRWNRPVSVSTKVTKDGTVVMEGFARQNPATSHAILEEIDKRQAENSKEIEAHQVKIDAERLQKIENARQKKKRVANGGDEHTNEAARHKAELVASINAENGCAIEDTTSESERELEIGKKTKTPISDRTPTAIRSNPSTGPPTLTIPGSPRAAKANNNGGLNLEQVNRLLREDSRDEQDTTSDGSRDLQDVSPITIWSAYLKSTAEYAKERAEADGVFGPKSLGGSANGYDAGPSAP